MTAEISNHDREAVLERLAAKHPGASVEILDYIDVAWSSWECDDGAVLYTADGVAGVAIVNEVASGHQGSPAEVLAERVVAYRQLADETERLLARYRSMGGT